MVYPLLYDSSCMCLVIIDNCSCKPYICARGFDHMWKFKVSLRVGIIFGKTILVLMTTDSYTMLSPVAPANICIDTQYLLSSNLVLLLQMLRTSGGIVNDINLKRNTCARLNLGLLSVEIKAIFAKQTWQEFYHIWAFDRHCSWAHLEWVCFSLGLLSVLELVTFLD